MPAASGHMTRKMWDLIIPVLDCSQLLKLCPSQCKQPAACPTASPWPRTDGPQHTMAGETRTSLADTRNRLQRGHRNSAIPEPVPRGWEMLSSAQCRQRTKNLCEIRQPSRGCAAVTRAAARIQSEMGQRGLRSVDLILRMRLILQLGP